MWGFFLQLKIVLKKKKKVRNWAEPTIVTALQGS